MLKPRNLFVYPKAKITSEVPLGAGRRSLKLNVSGMVCHL